jgi:hypothetical protein
VVQVTVCRCRQLEGPKADIVQGFVVNAEGFVRVLDKLMDGESGVVRLQMREKLEQEKLEEASITSTTVSDTLGLGTTEYVHIILSGYSSRIFEIRRVPIPAPVPPPSEWVIWKPVTWQVRKMLG